eukprot:3439914-Rhodomonas_salina.1
MGTARKGIRVWAQHAKAYAYGHRTQRHTRMGIAHTGIRVWASHAKAYAYGQRTSCSRQRPPSSPRAPVSSAVSVGERARRVSAD